ncbi:MAG: glutaredoxin 3 [Spirochaetota bacterium]
MAEIEVYTTKVCPYCVRAKALLQRKGVAFQEIDVSDDDAAREALVQKSDGRRTVPQIFIDGSCVGGCDDLYRLEAEGRLDGLLKA